MLLFVIAVYLYVLCLLLFFKSAVKLQLHKQKRKSQQSQCLIWLLPLLMITITYAIKRVNIQLCNTAQHSIAITPTELES